MKKYFCLLFFCVIFCFAPKAEAVDPATVTAAAPKAVELAGIWSPHAINTLQSCGIGLMNIGRSAASILLLPTGLLQCTLGAPFGMFDDGVNNCIRGGCAPFELVYEVIILPVRLVSLGAVR